MSVDDFLDYLSYKIEMFFVKTAQRSMQYKIKKYPYIEQNVRLGRTVQLIGKKNSFYIGTGTYINDAILSTGNTSHIRIGRRCAIGYRVSIKALTHHIDNPCPDEKGYIETCEEDIVIGDSCWIGDNVVIRQGVVLGDNVIVGANAVVTKSFPDNVTIAGVPAVIIKE